jgi:hypothetical protein
MRRRSGASTPRDPRLMLEALHVNDSRRPCERSRRGAVDRQGGSATSAEVVYKIASA